MEEWFNQIEKNKTWELVPRPKNKNVIGTKRGLRNKFNEAGKVIINTTSLVWKGYAQVEGIYFEEMFSPMAGLGAIRIFLAYPSFKAFKVYQMDVKSSFLNGDLEKEVYIEQLEGFQLSKGKVYVCKLRKYLYGMKQDPRAWYARLDKYIQ